MLNPISGQAAVPDAAETLNILGTTLSVLSDGRALPMMVGEQLVPPDHGVPVHVHATDDELFYIIEGELTVMDRQGERKVQAGDCVPLPHGLPHGFRNASASPARVLVVVAPGVQALEMFRRLDRAGRAGSLSRQDMVGIAAAHGVQFV